MWDAEWTLGLNSDVNTNRLGVSDTRGGALRRSEERASNSARCSATASIGPSSTTARCRRRATSPGTRKSPAELAQAIVAESARWGDMHRSTPYTKAAMAGGDRTDVINYLNARNSIFFNQLRTAGLYSNVVAPTFSQHGGQVPPGFDVSHVTAPAGTIWYTLDGSDPRMIGGGVKPGAMQYTGSPVEIPAGLTLKRARASAAASGRRSTRPTFTVAAPANATNLRIFEIHYNPAAQGGVADEQDLEFIELFNPSAETGQPRRRADYAVRHRAVHISERA